MFNFFLESFSKKVNDSLDAVKRILDLHRNPRLAEDVDHQYSDKYLLVEQMANTALIAQLNALTYFGLTAEILQSIDQSKTTTLRFQGSTSCTFLKDEIVEVPSQRKEEVDEHVESSLFGSTNRSTIKQVVHEVHEYHWKVDVDWEVSLYSGSDVEGRTSLKRRSSSMILIVQSNKEAPLPENQEFNPVEFSLSSLLKFVNTQKMASTFAIDRDAATTKTPCRNEQVAAVVTTMSELGKWTNQVRDFFVGNILEVYQRKHNPAGSAPILTSGQGDTWSLPEYKGPYEIHSSIFVPVVPFMETLPSQRATIGSPSDIHSRSVLTLEGPAVTEALSLSASATTILSSNDMHAVLNEQVRSIEERIASLRKMYPPNESMIAWSVEEVILAELCPYLGRIGRMFVEAVDYVESMLRNQLVAAIGKHIQLSDIEQFVRYHNARLLNPAPKPFCHAVRLMGHDPYGLLSIESTDADGTKTPIHTLCREIKSSNDSSSGSSSGSGSGSTVKVPLNSATTVELSGQKYLHGWIRHRFGQDQTPVELIARARQFSTFLLVVGTMSGSDQLEPKDAIIVQNKDEVLIPLILDEIPTSKEFKDAINSLSPEQQRFAKAFRNMQLASSVMGICVIQIKPQLEVLLGLGQGALTKEMKLTQDLMELFIEYQVPSDLVSYDGTDPGASRNERVANVKGHVKAVFDVIHATKGKELEEKITTSMADSFGTGMSSEIYIRSDGTKVRRARATPSTGGFGTAGGFGTSTSATATTFGSTPATLTGFGGGARSTSKGNRCPKVTPTGPSAPPAGGFGGSATMGGGGFGTSMCSTKPDDSAPPGNNWSPLGSNLGSMNEPNQVDSSSEAFSSNFASTHPENNYDVPSSTRQETCNPSDDMNFNFSAVPQLLNSTIEAHSSTIALRSTTIKLLDRWTRYRQADLLSKPTVSTMDRDGVIKVERNKARSGSLSIAFSELLVIVAVTHSFEKDVIDTIVQDNINPLEKLETSTLLVGSVIHGVPVSALVRDGSEVSRLTHME